MSCEDQALVPTEVCFKWGCEKIKLELVNGFWTCPTCRCSYGADAKEGLVVETREECTCTGFLHDINCHWM